MFRCALAAFAVLFALPTVALADSLGSAGRIAELEVNTTSADTYLMYHGRAVIIGKAGSTEYRWGGTSCGSRTLTESHVALLQRALDNGLTVQPRFQIGQGDSMCLVGFNIVG